MRQEDWRTHICAVEGVGELHFVVRSYGEVGLLLRDCLRAVEVVLNCNDGEGTVEDGNVRVDQAKRPRKSSVK